MKDVEELEELEELEEVEVCEDSRGMVNTTAIAGLCIQRGLFRLAEAIERRDRGYALEKENAELRERMRNVGLSVPE